MASASANTNSILDHLELGRSYDLEFGDTWNSSNDSNPSKHAFHTIKYDFKPASVLKSDQAELNVGSNEDVSITIPNIEGSSSQSTNFSGSTKPYSAKECLMIIDPKTGKISLERLSANVRVKNVRSNNAPAKPIVTRPNLNEPLVEKKPNKPVSTTVTQPNKTTNQPNNTTSSLPQKPIQNNTKPPTNSSSKPLPQKKNSPIVDDRLSDDESPMDLFSDNTVNSTVSPAPISAPVNKSKNTGFETLEHDLQLSDTTDDES